MDRKIINNFIYNTGYQVLVLILPLITTPYISRIFASEYLGIYGATASLVQMFILLGMCGIGAYGSKEIAKVRDCKEKTTNVFGQIFTMQSIMIIISLFIYILFFVILNESKFRLMYILQGINIVASIADISWFFIGIENLKKVVIRNTCVKIGALILILIFVKNPEDIYLYAFLLAISNVFGNLLMWNNIYSYISKIKISIKSIKKHLIDTSLLLIPQISYQIYTSFDRTILGYVSTFEQVGYFDQSQRIVRMSVGIVTSLGVVMMPRITNMISNRCKKSEVEKLLKSSLNITLFISVACSVGIICIADNFVPWFFSERYIDVSILLKFTAVVCLFTALGSFFSNQYAIPSNNKKAYIIPVMTAAILSIILNLILGYRLGAVGACITIVTVEFIALVLRMFFLRKELNYKYLFNSFHKYLISGVMMYLSIKGVGVALGLIPCILTTIIEISVGGVVYILSLFILEKEFRDLMVGNITKITNKISKTI